MATFNLNIFPESDLQVCGGGFCFLFLILQVLDNKL